MKNNPVWGPDRPKLLSDQTFKTEIISDEIFQSEITPDHTLHTQITSDQTFQTQRFSIRLFRPKALWSDALQTMIQTQIQSLAHTLNRLWSDSSTLKIIWAEQKFYLWTSLLILL